MTLRGMRARNNPLFMALLLACHGLPAVAERLELAAANTWPTAYELNGRPTGVLVELVTEAYRRAGYRVTFKLMPWSRCLGEAKTGKVDGVFSTFRLPEREAFLYFTHEVLTVQVISLFVRRNSTLRNGNDFVALQELRAGVIRETSYGTKFDDAVKTGALRYVFPTDSIETNLKMLMATRVDFIPSYRSVMLNTAKNLGLLGQIKELTPPLESVPSYLAFTRVKDRRKAAMDFDIALAAMKRDGTYQRIVERTPY
ncbi:substrate-binding periplasmic protein [Paludibacterium yongneupense]|uniref:substrate-binding periplasmic protein n=1 Tax=Paludibacterium yongneupense TaxID=400061 RepID=UPI0004069062|nr:transporter substrate-binding domain-containing protein [Paludibacterium yongneupense]